MSSHEIMNIEVKHSRIELTQLPKKVDEKRLLEAMRFETAKLHIGNKSSLKQVRRDISRRKRDWLDSAMKKND